MKYSPDLKKTLIIFIMGAACIFSFPWTAMAHPPKTISAEYDPATQNLTIRIDHGSFAPAMHYINKVEIKKNGETVLSKSYKGQPDKNPFDYIYNIPAREGDVFDVTATCNLYGSKTASIKVAK